MTDNYKKTMTKDTLSVYWQHTKKYKSKLFIIYPLMLVAQFAEDIAIPLLVSGIITKIAEKDLSALSLDLIWPTLLLIVALEYFAHTLWNIIVRIFWRAQETIMVDLGMTAYDHLGKLSQRFFANRFSGSLVNQLNKFVNSYERLTDPLTWNVFKLVVSVVFTAIILAPKTPAIVIAMLVLIAIYIPVTWMYRRKQLPLNQEWAAAESEKTGQLADTITNVDAVKAFSNQKLERKLMKQKYSQVYDSSMKTMKMNMRHEYVTGTIQRSINTSVIVLSVFLAVNGYIEAGVVYLALTYTTAILRRLWDLNNTFRNFSRVFGDAYDMTAILQIQPEVKDPEKPEKLKMNRGGIEFNSVTFTHNEDDEALFHNLDLSIKPGEKIGLVGHSGSGKTTLTKLLLRFMDIEGGEILIDGQDINSVTQDDLRTKISYVPQEPMMFHRTIAENILYGDTSANKQTLEATARLANAHDFIEKLPLKYKTLVGERGVKLSGGQRQRIAIARAMIKNAPILLLDEATSALDSESEALIQDALWKLMEGRTAIVIAHRLSTIQKMDRIVVLEEGEIVEQGSHKELVRLGGKYASLWNHQTGGFIEEALVE